MSNISNTSNISNVSNASNISLQNLENYKDQYTNTTTEIFSKYKGLITEYFVQCTDNIYIKNTVYYKHILRKGVETITHVFKILLLYTKNLSLTYVHCQKSLYYYVEFICQIGEDTHSFLQLNAKDASLFVYKKTIFDINNEYRKEFGSLKKTCIITKNVDSLIKIYGIYLSVILYDYDFTPENKILFIKTMNNSCNKLSQNIMNISLNISEEKYDEKLDVLHTFNDLITKYKEKHIPYSILFTKRLQKKNTTRENLENKFIMQDNDNRIKTMTPSKYINWLFS